VRLNECLVNLNFEISDRLFFEFRQKW